MPRRRRFTARPPAWIGGTVYRHAWKVTAQSGQQEPQPLSRPSLGFTGAPAKTTADPKPKRVPFGFSSTTRQIEIAR